MNQLKAGAALSYVIIALNAAVGLAYTPFMLRTLGQSEYGLYSLSASVIGYLTVLDLGFGNAVVRYTAKFRAEGSEELLPGMYGMFLSLYCVISAVAFALGLSLSFHAGGLFSGSMSAGEVGKVRVMLALLSFNLAFTFPMSIWGSIITAHERFVFLRSVNIARIVLNPLVMLFFLLAGYKSVAMVAVTTAFNVSTLTANWWYCRRRLGVRVRFSRFDWKFLREVSSYSFWVFLNAVMDRVYWGTGQFVLGVYRGASAVAVYAVAIQLQGMYMMFSTAISGVFLPRVTSMVSRRCGDSELSGLFIRTGRVQYLVLSYVLSCFVVFGRPFLSLWAGPGYGDAYVMALLFLVPLTVPLVQNVGINILMARNQMKFRSLLYVSIAVLSLFLSVYGARRYGGIGCAAAVSAALTAGQVVGMNVYYKRRQRLDIGRFWREIGRMSAVPAAFCAAGLAASRLADLSRPGVFAAGLLLFTALYVPCCWRFSMDARERGLFSAPLSRVPVLSRLAAGRPGAGGRQ